MSKCMIGELASYLNKDTERLVGEVMILLEAVISNDRQVEATKAVVKQTIWKFNKSIRERYEEILNEETK